MRELDVLLIDPSIISGDGHHYPYLNQHRIEFGRLGIDVRAFVSAGVDRDFARSTNLIPAFQKSLHGRRSYTAAEFIEFAGIFERDLTQMVAKHRLRPDIIVLTTADQSMLLGLAMYLKKSASRPEVLAWILTSPHHQKPADDPSIGPLLSEYEEAFSALCLAAEDRLSLFTEAVAMAAVYQPCCSTRIGTVAVRKKLQRPRASHVRRDGECINLVCVGAAAMAKGYSLLPESVRLLNRRRNDLRFSLHGTVAQTGFSGAKSIMEELSCVGPNVRVCTDNLSVDDYIAWLSDADIVMLPYDTYVYRTHGSAVFDECVGLGIPVVAPTACDFAKVAIADGRAVGIDEVTSGGLAGAVDIAADRLDELTERVARYAAGRGVDTGLRDTIEKAVTAAERRLSWLDLVRRRWRRRAFKRPRIA
jgi:glycosyltransferase involved in cell wall biosynthesis